MPYNYKYKMEWVGMKNANASEFYYRLEFYKKEETEIIYDVYQLIGSNKPFVLKYISKDDFAFEPFRPSSAEITLFLDENTEVEPEEFFSDTENTTYKVVLKLIDVTNSTETNLWTGFVLSGDVQYDWQQRYYLRLSATDNLAILKEYKYSQSDRFTMFETQSVYDGISIKDFVVKCLSFVGLELDVKFLLEYYKEEDSKNELSMFLSEYSAIDWDKRYPFDVYEILSKLMTTMGCILYQDNRDSTWAILSVNYALTVGSNAIPYRSYDFEGTALTSGNIDLQGTIARGGEYIWSDTNQIVTLKKKLDEVRIIVKNRLKNLVMNYGFFQGSVGSNADDWVDVSLTTPSEVSTFIQNPYDNRVLLFENSYSIGGFSNSKYTFQTIPLLTFRCFYNGDTGDSELISDNYNVYVNFDYQLLGTTGNILYFDLSVAFDRPEDSKFLAFDSNGIWNSYSSLNQSSIIRVFRKDTNNLQNFRALSKTTVGGLSLTPTATNWFNEIRNAYILIRPIATVVASTDYVLLDNFQLNLKPQSLTGKNMIYYANQTTPYWYTIKNTPAYKINIKEIDSMYTGGYYGGGFDAAYFEDCIMTKFESEFETLYLDSSINWTRQWQEHTENNYNHFDALTCASILSFYKSTGKKFTGNVYAEQAPYDGLVPFAFPMHLEVGGNTDINARLRIEDEFSAMVIADGGEVETSTCGADFLEEFYEVNSKFFMVSAEFDYATNKTNVTLHQDFTDTKELGFFVGTLGQSGGSLDNKYLEVGSSSGDTQDEITAG
jgi:hypothetical protein